MIVERRDEWTSKVRSLFGLVSTLVVGQLNRGCRAQRCLQEFAPLRIFPFSFFVTDVSRRYYESLTVFETVP